MRQRVCFALAPKVIVHEKQMTPTRQRRSTSPAYPLARPDYNYSLGEHVYDSFVTHGLLEARLLSGCFSRPQRRHGVVNYLHPAHRGWRTWVAHVATRVANRCQLLQAVRSLQSGSRGRAWRAWVASWLEHRLFLSFCARVVKRLRSSVVARAVQSWLSFAEQRRHQMRLIRKSIARLVAVALAGAFAQWNYHGVESGSSLALLRRAINALVRRGQWLAFSTWQTHGREATKRDRLARWALARMRTGAARHPS